MPEISYDVNSSHFSTVPLKVRISKNETNAFYLKSDGKIGVKDITASINSRNTPGDGIDGDVGQPLPVLKFNRTVSRKVTGDPNTWNEGVCIPDMLEGYWPQQDSNQE